MPPDHQLEVCPPLSRTRVLGSLPKAHIFGGTTAYAGVSHRQPMRIPTGSEVWQRPAKSGPEPLAESGGQF